MQKLPGYAKWEKFEKVLDKGKDVCHIAGQETACHFPDDRKVIEKSKGAIQDIDGMLPTRYTCYLVGQNGDSCKPITRPHKLTLARHAGKLPGGENQNDPH